MLFRRLARLAFRLRLRRSLDGAVAGLTWGLGTAILLLIVGKLTRLDSAELLAAGAVASGFLAGAAARFARPVPLRQAAALADLGAGSDEVISTAFETPPAGRFGAEVHARAEAVLTGRRDSELLPRPRFRMPWIPAILALVLAGLFPIPAVTTSPVTGSAPAAISPAVLKALERSAKEMKRIGNQTSNPELTHLAEEMERMAASVRLGELTKKEALAKIASLTDRAEEARRELDAKTEALRSLARDPETKSLASSAARGNGDGARKSAEELARKVASGELDPEKLESLKETLDRVSKDGRGDVAKAAAMAAKALMKKDPKEFGRGVEKLADGLKGAWVPEELLQGADKELEADRELAQAMKGLAEAEGDLMTDEEIELALKEFCDDCGKKKDAKGGG